MAENIDSFLFISHLENFCLKEKKYLFFKYFAAAISHTDKSKQNLFESIQILIIITVF